MQHFLKQFSGKCYINQFNISLRRLNDGRSLKYRSNDNAKREGNKKNVHLEDKIEIVVVPFVSFPIKVWLAVPEPQWNMGPYHSGTEGP